MLRFENELRLKRYTSLAMGLPVGFNRAESSCPSSHRSSRRFYSFELSDTLGGRKGLVQTMFAKSSI